MTKKCKFEVELTYNSDYFTEPEIQDTIRNAIKKLDLEKRKKFGTKVICEVGKVNSGVVADVTKCEVKIPNEIDVVETLVSLSSCMEDDDDSKMILPEHRVDELMDEVRTAFKQ